MNKKRFRQKETRDKKGSKSRDSETFPKRVIAIIDEMERKSNIPQTINKNTLTGTALVWNTQGQIVQNKSSILCMLLGNRSYRVLKRSKMMVSLQKHQTCRIHAALYNRRLDSQLLSIGIVLSLVYL